MASPVESKLIGGRRHPDRRSARRLRGESAHAAACAGGRATGSSPNHSASPAPLMQLPGATLCVEEDSMSASRRKMYYKTKFCEFLRSGYCGRGDSCTFAHSVEELQPRPDGRTSCFRRPCGSQHLLQHAADGVLDLTWVDEKRSKDSALPDKNPGACSGPRSGSKGVSPGGTNHSDPPSDADLMTRRARTKKTKLCKYYDQGDCHKGRYCDFAHGILELRQLEPCRTTPDAKDTWEASTSAASIGAAEARQGQSVPLDGVPETHEDGSSLVHSGASRTESHEENGNGGECGEVTEQWPPQVHTFIHFGVENEARRREQSAPPR